MEAAARLLARVSAHFPIEGTADAPRYPGTQFEHNLHVNAYGYEPVPLDAARQLLGELGAPRLARREFIEALDALSLRLAHRILES